MVRCRLGVWLPLTVLVAVLAHGLRFGAQHLPAGAHAASLFGTLGATLGLAGLAALYAAALRPEAGRLGSERAMPAVLALGGLGAYGLIELSEGHAPFAGGTAVVLAVVVAATVVAGLFHLVSGMLAASGRALARLAGTVRIPGVAPAFCCDGHRLLFRCRLAGGDARGRAPPFYA
ncbi:MAG: hypothetical protein GIX03_04530 [Candidatus Eremiobacteraeota bacterium]|nr:hypothetical protein [Candidatus Eremiobacteraeota bacterium]MBC5802265.1 hypothetical protein [Candidatus Eremiobacteraeota bacterium]MBC5822152.1 hypothetical protein [Candidatus Eremiobacteraeota bacterium]